MDNKIHVRINLVVLAPYGTEQIGDKLKIQNYLQYILQNYLKYENSLHITIKTISIIGYNPSRIIFLKADKVACVTQSKLPICNIGY